MSITPNIMSMGVELECNIPRSNMTFHPTAAQDRKYHLSEDADNGSANDRFAFESRKRFGKDSEGHWKFDKHWHKDPSVDVLSNLSSTHTSMEYTFHSDKKEEIFKWLKMAYEEFGVVTHPSREMNNGFHIHIRLNPEKLDTKEAARALVWEKYFNETVGKFKEHYAHKPEYIERLGGSQSMGSSGNHNWSNGTYNEPYMLSELRGSGRYSFYNLSAIQRGEAGSSGHTRGVATIEIRVLPGQKNLAEAEESINYITGLMDEELEHIRTTEGEDLKKVPIPIPEGEDKIMKLQRQMKKMGIKVEIKKERE